MSLFDPSLMAITHPHRYCQHTHKSICWRRMHTDIFCFCSLVFVSAGTAPPLAHTCTAEPAAETKEGEQKKAENVCGCGGICKDITAGRISNQGTGKQTEPCKHSTYTEPQGPGFCCPQCDRGPYAKHIHPHANYICTQGKK